MTINRKFFFDEMHERLFKNGLKQHQVDGIEAILDKWEADHSEKDDRWLAYMLATAYHETAFTMQPVRETMAPTDDKAIAILDRAYNAGKLPQVKFPPYWRKDADGKSWLGRGDVQLTFKNNYQEMSGKIGVDLVAHPEKAMELDVALKIMFVGMEQGSFTGKKLGDYFNKDTADWVQARKIINGLDRAREIAGYGNAFYAAISYTT